MDNYLQDAFDVPRHEVHGDPGRETGVLDRGPGGFDEEVVEVPVIW